MLGTLLKTIYVTAALITISLTFEPHYRQCIVKEEKAFCEIEAFYVSITLGAMWPFYYLGKAYGINEQ